MFRNACGFWNSFCSIGNELGRTGNLTLVGPLWVNLSFSTELYLKFLLHLSTGQVVKIHDLHKLFNMLPVDQREAITHNYESVLAESEFYRTLGTIWTSRDFKLSIVLAKAAKTFQVWRYPGDGVDLNAPGTLQHVVLALQRHIGKQFPDAFAKLQGPLGTCGLSIYGGIAE